jgi:membrane associated rhomboid family serine protease
MNHKEDIRQEIVNSDILKIFVLLFSFFALLQMVRIYSMMNGQGIGEFINTIYPYVTVSNNTMHNITRPWILITHLGAEIGVMGMLSNFLWLYLFGYIIQDLKGKNSVWPLFVLAGVLSAVAVIICVAIKPTTLQTGFYYGMRTSIVAVATAAVVFRPTYKVFQMLFGGFSLWILGVIFLLLSLSTGGLDIANVVAIFVAVLVGYLYNNVLDGFFMAWQSRLNNNATSNRKLEAASRNKKPKYNSTMVVNKPSTVIDMSQHKMDALLDKIAANGLDSLTATEKQWLQDFSNKNKTE